jgi:hypothetical protein
MPDNNGRLTPELTVEEIESLAADGCEPPAYVKMVADTALKAYQEWACKQGGEIGFLSVFDTRENAIKCGCDPSLLREIVEITIISTEAKRRESET